MATSMLLSEKLSGCFTMLQMQHNVKYYAFVQLVPGTLMIWPFIKPLFAPLLPCTAHIALSTGV